MLITAEKPGDPQSFEMGVSAGDGDLKFIPKDEKALLRHDVEITKSDSDNRLYRAITLSNQLKVLLISDSYTDKAAACLAVAVGSFYDPVDVPGLAHFCEHMILLGSQKYPGENEYSKFITSHSGYCNAFTSTTETCYVFDIAPDYLYEALKRFSGLFVAPLFTESATEREVNAVNSEHEKNLSIDNRRIVRIDKIMAAPDHDYAKFTTGNKDTLFNNLKLKSRNVRDELVRFYERFYSSNIMAVTILGKESLDEMENKYAPLFEDIPNWNVVPKSWLTTPWTKEYLQPCGYPMHLLGHESAGSLLSALKRRSLATNLMTETYRPGSGFACVILYASLTDNGLGVSKFSFCLCTSYFVGVKISSRPVYSDCSVFISKIRTINVFVMRFYCHIG
ncbi:Insulin-degrading enzyme [Taenia solium]|eukprot:TsM_001095800 transcript=TsM_001095800 gene=TsM_001095800